MIIASRDTVGTLIESVRKSTRDAIPSRSCRTAVEEANRRVYEKAREDENLAGMGTTVVVRLSSKAVISMWPMWETAVSI